MVEFQMVRFSNGRAFAMARALVPPFENWTIQNPDVFARISNGLTKWRPFVQISNGWASGLQIPFATQPFLDH